MYVDRLVEGDSGEQMCLAVRPHWFRIVKQGRRSLLLILSGVIMALLGELLARLVAQSVPDLQILASHVGAFADTSAPASNLQLYLESGFDWGGIVFAFVGALLLGWTLLDRYFTEYAITISPGYGGRIIKVQGVLSRQTVAVPLSMVNDLVLYEPLLGRLLGWGDIDIATGNDYEGDRLEYTPNTRDFYQVWKTLIDQGYGGRWSTSVASSDPESGRDTWAGMRLNYPRHTRQVRRS